MTAILALDTSSEQCSVCLWQNGRRFAKQQSAARQHAQLLMPMIREVLAEAKLSLGDLDALAFAAGPGSFTGLRIAAGVIQGLAFGADLPVLRVSTLAAMAHGAALKHAASARVLSCIDARMGQVYWATFDVSKVALADAGTLGCLPLPLGEAQVSDPHTLAMPEHLSDQGLTVVGSGLAYVSEFPTALRAQIQLQDASICANAEHVAALAVPMLAQNQAVPAEQALPVYLRNEVAWKKLPGR